MSKLSKLSVKKLFAIALQEPLSDIEWPIQWDEYKPRKRGIFKIYPWDALGELQKRATPKIYRKARKLCGSKNPNERHAGAHLLAYFDGRDSRLYRKERMRFLLKMIDKESDAVVLGALTFSLGHFQNAHVNEALLSLRDHDDHRVRFGVAMSLHLFDFEMLEMVEALIELSADSAALVRDWATFRLRYLEFDSEAIRDALHARLSDSDAGARGEAMLGLITRKDQRVFEPLLAALEQMPEDTLEWGLALEAAKELADVRLLPALRKLQENWEGEKNRIYSYLQDAIAACEKQQAEFSPKAQNDENTSA